MMKIGDLLKVNGRLATVAGQSYTKLVYDVSDYELGRAGFEGGTACPFVDVVFSDTGRQGPINLARVQWEIVA